MAMQPCSLAAGQPLDADLTACVLHCPCGCRRRECRSELQYIPSLLAMYGLDNEASCLPFPCHFGLACRPRAPCGSCCRHLGALQLGPAPAPLLLTVGWAPLHRLQTTCDASGGTFQQWVPGEAAHESAADRAGAAPQGEDDGGHFQTYQPGHVTPGGRCSTAREAVHAARRRAASGFVLLDLNAMP